MKFKLLSDLHLEFYGARPFYKQEAVKEWEPAGARGRQGHCPAISRRRPRWSQGSTVAREDVRAFPRCGIYSW